MGSEAVFVFPPVEVFPPVGVLAEDPPSVAPAFGSAAGSVASVPVPLSLGAAGLSVDGAALSPPAAVLLPLPDEDAGAAGVSLATSTIAELYLPIAIVAQTQIAITQSNAVTDLNTVCFIVNNPRFF